MSIVESVAQQIGEDVLQTAKDYGWNEDIGRKESAFAYVLRKQYEKGVEEANVFHIMEIGKYKRTVTLQRRVAQLQGQRIGVLEVQLASLQGTDAANRFIDNAKFSALNAEGKLSYPIQVQAPCRAQQVDSKMVCKCGNMWNPYNEFWPACRINHGN